MKTKNKFNKEKIYCFISIIILLWIFLSFIDVNLNNLGIENNYARWNLFTNVLCKN